MEVRRGNTVQVGSCSGCSNNGEVWSVELQNAKVRLCTDCRDELMRKTAIPPKMMELAKRVRAAVMQRVNGNVSNTFDYDLVDDEELEQIIENVIRG